MQIEESNLRGLQQTRDDEGLFENTGSRRVKERSELL